MQPTRPSLCELLANSANHRPLKNPGRVQILSQGPILDPFKGAGEAGPLITSITKFPPSTSGCARQSAIHSAKMTSQISHDREKAQAILLKFKKRFKQLQEQNPFKFPLVACGKLNPNECILSDISMRRMAAGEFLGDELVRYVSTMSTIRVCHVDHPSQTGTLANG